MHQPFPVTAEPVGGWSPYLLGILERLEGHFGPRHWWPAVGVPAPAAAPAFEMIVGAILVQNTAWTNTERALLALRDAGLLEPARLYATPQATIEALIRPTGYYHQKARKLRDFLDHVFTHYAGDLGALLARPLQELRLELLNLRGIGPETGDCILCYAAHAPVMPMDTYTRRIFARLGILAPDAAYDDMQEFFHTYLPAAAERLGEYHAQIDTLGHRLCLKARPACAGCPLQDTCPRLGVTA